MKRTKKEKLAPALIDFAADMLKCVGHPVRLRIVELLESCEEAAVSQIQEELGLPQPVVSQHLTRMKLLGLLRARRSQGMVFYSVALPQLFKLLDCIRSCDPGVSFRHQAG
ncbi:MAG: winged helix-turn-helix transcriptional regulator [Candidatus Eremiobacteraeota bacterium]|nr:winged helix-turn-helix transcriptional regulator [Candidatus Eremiobacteraeota bacterium]MCW5871829.1 winged helix-turn-helix transcriptional regulator [Candidatus Eremiobacteraeota bacterium]